MSMQWAFFLARALLFCSCNFSDAAGATERTLAMVKPDGVRANCTDAIKHMIREQGFKIVAEKDALFTELAARTFYAEHSEQAFFPDLVGFMTSGPVLVMVLEKHNAIKDWRALMGPTDSDKARLQAPTSVRAKFGLDGQSNCVHGSDSPEAAAREITAFFDVATAVVAEEVSELVGRHEEL